MKAQEGIPTVVCFEGSEDPGQAFRRGDCSQFSLVMHSFSCNHAERTRKRATQARRWVQVRGGSDSDQGKRNQADSRNVQGELT